MGILSGAAKGFAKAGGEVASGIISDQLEARRQERLASIRASETAEQREYQKGVRAEEAEREAEIYGRRTAEEQERYQRRQTEADKKEAARIAAEEKKYQRRKTEQEEGREYTTPEGRVIRGGKAVQYQPSEEQIEEEIQGRTAEGDAYLPGLIEEVSEAEKPRDLKIGSRGGKSDEPAMVKAVRSIAQWYGVSEKEAHKIYQRSKGDPRKIAANMYQDRLSEVTEKFLDETPDQSWDRVADAMTRAGYEGFETKGYQTKEQVRDALRRGEISREEAKRKIQEILKIGNIER